MNPEAIDPNRSPFQLILTARRWMAAAAQLYWGAAPPQSARILVVDDDPSLLSLLRILLATSGFQVTVARDGSEALNLTATNQYDLILLDLEMPGVNGRTFFHRFRAEGKSTPVVVISAYGAEGANREIGAQGFVAKPFEPEALVRTVERLLTR